MNKHLITLILLLSGALTASAQTTVKFNDPHIRYVGRIAQRDTAAELSWTGNSVKINFNGTGVKALMKDQGGINYFKVIVDGKPQPDLKMNAIKHLYTLVSGLPPGPHSLELFKRTEWAFGKTWFYGFVLDDHATIAAVPEARKRKIEFFGNSITCGYAVLDTAGKDRGDPPFEDGYLSYAAITARYFNADYVCTSKSGIGVLVSWFPLIMPEMYDRLDANDPDSKWDFNRYKPDIVVINLFQNDSWIVKQPTNAQYISRFGSTPPTEENIVDAYRDLVKNIRSKYPSAQIICALGSMDATQKGSPWPGYITKAVAGLHDAKISAHFFPYKNTGGHPSKAEQQAMANDLIAYIDNNIKW